MTLEQALDLANAADVRTILEPVSVPEEKVVTALIATDRPLSAVTPNRTDSPP